MIYHLILVDLDYKGRPHRPWLPSLRQPALTQVNRQIRRDTLPMFFSNNMFILRVPSPDHNPDLDHVREEQRWMRFIRGLKLFSACGYLPIVRHLTITYTDHGPDMDQGSVMFGTGRGAIIKIECCCAEPKAPNYEEIARKMGTSADRLRLYWQLMMGTRVGNDETDWSDRDAVDEALSIAIDEFATAIRGRGYLQEAGTVDRMPVGRLVGALHALFTGQGGSMKYLVLSAADRARFV